MPGLQIHLTRSLAISTLFSGILAGNGLAQFASVGGQGDQQLRAVPSMASRSKALPAKTPPSTPLAENTASGGWLGGADDCNVAHTNLGSGELSDLSFDNSAATTGSAGQFEGFCFMFGTSGIDNDVWFDWTSTETGQATLTSCAGTTVDTKIAVYPVASSCPPIGSSLGCNDDACGFQSTTVFPVAAGLGYTIQLGTFPGASGGAGTFSLTVSQPPPCGRHDDGMSESALGLVAGGEMAWLHEFHCGTTLSEIQTTYGTALAPGTITNGNASKIAVWEDTDCDGDPTTGLVLLDDVQAVVENGNTDIFNAHPIGPVQVSSGCCWIGASADQVAGEFPGGLDQQNATPLAWVVGSTLGPGTLDINDLNNNNVPPMQIEAIGFPAAWFLRADVSGGPARDPGVPLCFGDGSGTACPCGNAGTAANGCANSTYSAGSRLSTEGTLDPDSLVLHVARATPNEPGLFIQGDMALNFGMGIVFGDGLRCVGENVVRLEVVTANVKGAAASTIELSTQGGALPGETKYYQFWYRDPQLSLCGSGFNLTSASAVLW